MIGKLLLVYQCLFGGATLKRAKTSNSCTVEVAQIWGKFSLSGKRKCFDSEFHDNEKLSKVEAVNTATGLKLYVFVIVYYFSCFNTYFKHL